MINIELKDFPAIYQRICTHMGTDKQGDIALALGMKQSAISDLLKIAEGKSYQKGAKNLPYRQLVNWALTYGVSIDWLLTGQEPVAQAAGSVAGNDFVALPAWDSRPLEEAERTLLNETLEVLRSPGLPGKWDETLTGVIQSSRSGVAIEADRPRPRSPALDRKGGQKKASEGGQQG